MTLKLLIVGVSGSAIAYFDMGYGFLVILFGLIFILFLELWRFKKRRSRQ